VRIHRSFAVFTILALTVSFVACDQKGTPAPAPSSGGSAAQATNPTPSQPATMPPGHPPVGATSRPTGQQQELTQGGKVLETMNAGTYTYVLVDKGSGEQWWAAPKFEVAVGDPVALPQNGMPMKDFESPTLGRKFDVIYFATAIEKLDGSEIASAVEKAHGAARKMAPELEVAKGSIAKAEGGMTVAEIFRGGKDLAGKEIVLRGKVVKFNGGILDRNWIHLRDGSGGEGTNDITVTSAEGSAKVGDVVLIRGTLVADKDFGYGYKYDLLIEEAEVTVEK
jgi:hypothetical protein